MDVYILNIIPNRILYLIGKNNKNEIKIYYILMFNICLIKVVLCFNIFIFKKYEISLMFNII